MQITFADTAGWIALIDEDDWLHDRAFEAMAALRRAKVTIVTTGFVLLEVADALSAPGIRARTCAFVDGLFRSGDARIIRVTADLWLKGWRLYTQRPDKDWGLTDCTSFVIMEDEGIRDAFTSDRHFEQAGFVKLL